MKRVILFLLVPAALLLAGCGKVNVTELLEESKYLAQQGDQASWEQVRKNLQKVLGARRLPREAEGADRLHNFYVQSLMRTGRTTHALTAAKRSARLFPASFLSNYLLGKLYYDQGSLAKAAPCLETALALKAKDVNTLTLLVVAAGKTGQPNADEYFAQAAALAEFKYDARFYNEWGQWLLSRGKTMQALAKFAEARRQKNVDPVVYMSFAVLYDHHLELPKGKSKELARYYYKKYLSEMQKYPGSRPDTLARVEERLRELR